jgi:metallo-beta-lactamase family protein
MEIIFWGATEEVTGSMTFVRLPGGLICVDAGLYQGTEKTEGLNETQLPFKANEIQAVILTHAHLDHSGYIPLLIKNGFRGKIFCTKPTAALIKIILEDSAKIPDQHYYDQEHVKETLKHLSIMEWNVAKSLLGARFKLIPAGHILGASSLKIESEGKTVVFSGDLGRKDDPMMKAPPPCSPCDAVIMESTYGNRNRTGNIEEELDSFLMKISRESRIGIIASFAVARGQLLITLINDFFNRHPDEKVRVVFDSPMMGLANEVYQKYSSLTKNPESLKKSLKVQEMIENQGEWESLKKKKGPLIIISSSGMLTGGRIGRHLENWQNDKTAILYLPGFQSEGTPGREILNGQRTIKTSYGGVIHWQGEVLSSDAFSSHADHDELIEWTNELDDETEIHLIHGDKEAKTNLKKDLSSRFKSVHIPSKLETINLKQGI